MPLNTKYTPAAIEQEARQMWSQVFDEDPAFLDLLFRSKFSLEDYYYQSERGEIVSSLHAFAYTFRYLQKEFPMRYIAGVATLPTHRGAGRMAQLFRNVLYRLAEKGIVLATLLPAEASLYNYYRPFGFVPIQVTQTHYIRALKSNFTPPEDFTQEHYLFYQKAQQERCSVQHNYADWQTILSDLILSGGVPISIRDARQHLTGIAWAYPKAESGHLLLKDWVYTTPLAKEQLLQAAANQMQASHITVLEPGNQSSTVPHGMMRILTPLPLLQQYAATHPTLETIFAYTDPVLTPVSGVYTLRQGKCRFQAKNSQHPILPVQTPESLATLLMGNPVANTLGIESHPLFQTLMLD